VERADNRRPQQVERDEPGDRPDSSPDSAPPPSEWTVEDFDDFEPFEEIEPTEEGEAQQTALEFDSTVPDEPATPDAVAVDRDAESAPEREADIEFTDESTPDEKPPGTWEAVVDDAVAAEEEATAPTLDAVDDELAPEEDAETDEAAPEEEPAGREPLAVVPSGTEAAFDDTVEAMFEGGEVASPSGTAEEEDAFEVPEFAVFTSEQYLQTTTQEFVDLAEEMARAAETEHEPSAVAAEIPGLESGIVGLEDVVVASGEDPNAIAMRGRSNLALRVFTAVGLAVIFFASLYDELFIGLFVLVVLFLAAGEFYSALMRFGFRPLGLFGLLGTLGALAGTWVWGLVAIPVALAATLVATLLFFGLSDRRAPLTNISLTLLGLAWVGGLGAFLLDFLRSDDYGWFIVATVITVALMDIASYVVGRRMGRARLAPLVSPNKTIEGLVGGMVVAVAVGLLFGLLSEPVLFLDLESPIDLGAGLALGVVVALVAPLGDLAVSVMKRAIGVKDMGTLLPGHGGLLDRIDAMLFAIPFAWVVFSWTGLLA
jgi:phosphatidate cytidylyltransferase